jgi:hypothetical protein
VTTATTDPARSFVDALAPHVRARLTMTQAVAGMVHAAIRDHGWTVKQLVDECSRDLGDAINAGALITHRLRHAAGNPPPPASGLGLTHRALCGRCEDGWLVDPVTKMPLDRCPCRSSP